MKKTLVAAALSVSLFLGGTAAPATAQPAATPVAQVAVVTLYDIQTMLSMVATILTIVQVTRSLQGGDSSQSS
ncbi:hypothetical protein ACFSSC_08070 [Corynebacterium mendelii]|uniref:Uncharacterized protein n=1 Tax=Corynebacterium mendelii TaxID=2765362 RepID=A0A939E1F7_9CORY|nr:hypothetical protein [Corynebacterium mendelii]MBN9644711.1 hypothetical protein [Corynebacterium mendelii]